MNLYKLNSKKLSDAFNPTYIVAESVEKAVEFYKVKNLLEEPGEVMFITSNVFVISLPGITEQMTGEKKK